MIFFLSKKMDNLEKLVKLQKELKAKTIDRKLTQLNFYDRTSKLFQPITNTIEKGTKDINENLKILENALNQQNLKTIEGAKPNLPIILKTNSMDKLPKTWAFNQLKDGTFLLNKQPVTIENDTIRLSASNTSYPFTNNFKALLYGEDVNNIDNYDDLNSYLNFIKESGSSQSAMRYKSLIQRINNLRKIGNSLQTIVIPNSIEKIKERLQILLAARKSGHSNISLEEITTLLDNLLENKEITKKDYLKILHENE